MVTQYAIFHGGVRPSPIWVIRSPVGNHGENPRWQLNWNFVTKKSKMAANVNFSESLGRTLQRAKSDCLGQTSSGDGMKKVNDFFSELEVAVEVLEDKFSSGSTFANVQMLLRAQGMVAKALKKGTFEDCSQP